MKNPLEVVKAFVVKKDESLTEQEVIDFCKDNLTAYKCPKSVSFLKRNCLSLMLVRLLGGI